MSTALQRAVMERNVGLVKSLLDSGEDPNESPLDVSPLMLAVLVSDNDIVKLLISNPHTPADPNFGHEERDLLIHYAVQEGNIALVELLLTESVIKVDVNAVGSDGCTPLTFAVIKKNLEIVRLLLHASSNPNLCDYNGYAPIHYAVHYEDMMLVTLLLTESVIKVDVNSVGSDGCTPLTLAVIKKNLEIVRLLLHASSNPNLCDYNGYAPIHYAVHYEDMMSVTLLLTESVIKVDVNSVGSDGCTPLTLAVIKKNFDIVRLLLHASSNPNLCDYNGYAPIHYAVHYEDMMSVTLLLTESVIKVDVNLQDSEGCTPLALAVKTKNFAIAKLLLEAESDPNICDNDVFTPIDHAVAHGGIALVRLLFNESLIELDVNAHRDDGWTSLSHAVQMKDFAIVKLLLESGSDPNIMDSYGYTTIHYAVEYGDTAMVKLLLTESLIKVDVDIEQQHEGDTPLTIAIRQNDTAIAKLLIEAGADINCPRAFIVAVRQENLNMCKLLIEHGYDVNMPLSDKCHSAVHLAAKFNVDIVRYLVEKCAADIFAEPGRLLKNAVIKDRPEVLDYLLKHAYKLRGDEAWWGYKF